MEMVKRILIVLLLIIPMVLSLTSCDLMIALFSLSPFPAYLSQAVAVVDMSVEVTSFLGNQVDDWWHDVFALQDGLGNEAVFLIIHKPTGGQRVFLFDTSLAMKSTAYLDYNSDSHLVDDSGNFVVGDIRFDPGTMSFVESVDTDAGRFAFSDGSNNFDLNSYYNEPLDESTLEVRSGTGWPVSPTASHTICIGERFELRGLGYEPLTDSVYLFLYNWEFERLRIVETPGSQYPSSLIANILYEPTYNPSAFIDEPRGEYFRYTRKGFVSSARQRGFLMLFNNAGEVLKQFYLGIEDQEARGVDFDLDGEYYYVFNPNNYRLYKAETGF
jgi:hypothetical protein